MFGVLANLLRNLLETSLLRYDSLFMNQHSAILMGLKLTEIRLKLKSNDPSH